MRHPSSITRTKTVLLILMSVCAYSYLILCAKRVYDENLKLAEVKKAIEETKQMFEHIGELDRNLKERIDRLRKNMGYSKPPNGVKFADVNYYNVLEAQTPTTESVERSAGTPGTHKGNDMLTNKFNLSKLKPTPISTDIYQVVQV